MPTKEDLRERLRMRLGTSKMARLPNSVKTEKIDKIKEILVEEIEG
jgi:hypothetical protein